MKRGVLAIGLLAALVAAMPAYAALLPSVNGTCIGLIGCNAGSANIPATFALKVVAMLLQIAAGLAVLFIVFAGFQMVSNLGDEGKISQFKHGVANAMIGLCVAIFSEAFVSIVGNPNIAVAGVLPIALIGAAVSVLKLVLNSVFVIIVIIAGLRMVYAQGKSDEYNKGKTMLFWAAIGAVVVNLAAALASAVTTFFGV
ncbi:MAG TPA: hypothetical protein VHA78_03875 [Candidatus Peribacteraceae bacterium]|nr:hypothetical protein [Candidatus Peribacteraceae bacterium]